jgi:hypothetical protein
VSHCHSPTVRLANQRAKLETMDRIPRRRRGGNKGKEKGWEDGTFSLAASCARDEREREHKARPDGDTVKNKYCKDALNTQLEEGRISPGSRRNDQQPCSNAWRRVDLGARREPNHLVYRRIRSRGQSI